MSGGCVEKTCEIQIQWLIILMLAVGTGKVHWFEFSVITQFNGMISDFEKYLTITVS
jgi:hypothetical protein